MTPCAENGVFNLLDGTKELNVDFFTRVDTFAQAWNPHEAIGLHHGGDDPSATAQGLLSFALIASPVSPVKPACPFPAMVVMMPVATLTLRMRWLFVSAI